MPQRGAVYVLGARVGDGGDLVAVAATAVVANGSGSAQAHGEGIAARQKMGWR